jgi:hypothetical protein
MNAAIQKFETISFLRGGRISGFLDSQRTPFYLSKKLMQVARIDEQGRPARVPQWIIDLEAPVDVAELLRENEDVETAIVQAHRAAQVLEDRSSVTNEAPRVGEVAQPTGSGEGEPTLAKVLAFADRLGIPGAAYGAYADRRWGPGWKLNPHGRRRAWDDIERHRNDPSGFLDKVDATARGVA